MKTQAVKTAKVRALVLGRQEDGLERVGVKGDGEVEGAFPGEIKLDLRDVGKLEIAGDGGGFAGVKGAVAIDPTAGFAGHGHGRDALGPAVQSGDAVKHRRRTRNENQ